MSSEDFCIFCKFLTVCGDHTTFTGGHVFGRIETEASHISKVTYLFTIVFRTMSLCCIFNDNQVMLFCDFHYRFHICSLTIQLNRHDSFSLVSDCFFNLCRVNGKGFRVYINKDRASSSV